MEGKFASSKTLEERKAQFENLMAKDKTRIPIIVEKATNSKLKETQKTK